ncbi:MAG: acVLRF1 family peptidyl-tRNA hydrolase [Micromonosporaceae bacterium]
MAAGKGGRPAAGGGRWIEVAPARLARWLDGFAERHGQAAASRTDAGLAVTAADGAVADCQLPYGWRGAGTTPDELVAEANAEDRIGLLLVRRGACAVGIAVGDKLLESKVDRRLVQGRSAAGGWSQQRFARRREKQARESAEAGADTAARLLLPRLDTLRAVVGGGDRKAVDAVLGDRRLAPVAERVGGWFLDVPEPRHTVLVEAVVQARTVRIRLTEPPPDRT